MRTIALTFLVGLILGSSGSWWYYNANLNKTTEPPVGEEVFNNSEEEEAEDIESKIEEINQLEHLSRVEIGGSLEELFGDCNPEQEIEFLQKRYSCNKSINKSESSWNSMDEAELAVSQMLQQGKYDEISKYIGCDAYDLTWYELHCESDRSEVQGQHIEVLAHFIKAGGLNIQEARWVRKKPDPRKFRNPRWVWRSRLVLPGLKLSEPWNNEGHPTESETVILLEQKLSGRISIVGVPITGVSKDQSN